MKLLRRPRSLSSAAALWALLFISTLALFATMTPQSANATGESQLTIGMASDLKSVDPMRASSVAEVAVAGHAYECLVRYDVGGVIAPSLAASWRQLDESTWQFNFRRDIRFHDGTRMTGADVAYSIRKTLGTTAGTSWLTVSKVESATITLGSRAAYATMMQALAHTPIVPAASEMALASNPWRVIAGTGPYRITTAASKGVTLEANDHYWSKPPTWKTVQILALPDAADRVNALTNGTADVIDQVPAQEIDRLGADKRFSMTSVPTGRLMFLQLGTHTSNPPEVSSVDAPGAPMSVSPLTDPRVRRAISEAIDRRELAAIGVKSLGEPAGQLVPRGFFGYVPGIIPDRRDVADARTLLTEAGYPKGFSIKVHGPRGVYPGDAEVLAALAGMLRDVGIQTEAVAETPATFAVRAAQRSYSAYLRGFVSSSPDVTEALIALLATPDQDTGVGGLNWARYSNGTLDGLIQQAAAQPKNDARELFLQEATRLAMRDVFLLPLYFVNEAWGARSGLAFDPNATSDPLAERTKARAQGEGTAARPSVSGVLPPEWSAAVPPQATSPAHPAALRLKRLASE